MKKLICVITGNKRYINDDQYDKKIQEFGNEQSLEQFYVSAKAKKLLDQGYSVSKIREQLSCPFDLPQIDDDVVNHIKNHGKMVKTSTEPSQFSHDINQKTKPHVKQFIKKIKERL